MNLVRDTRSMKMNAKRCVLRQLSRKQYRGKRTTVSKTTTISNNNVETRSKKKKHKHRRESHKWGFVFALVSS